MKGHGALSCPCQPQLIGPRGLPIATMGMAPLPQRFPNSERDQKSSRFIARHMFASHKSVIFSAQAGAIFRPRFLRNWVRTSPPPPGFSGIALASENFFLFRRSMPKILQKNLRSMF
jgi:hypothetical protein